MMIQRTRSTHAHNIRNVHVHVHDYKHVSLDNTYHSGQGSFSTHCTFTVFKAEIKPSIPSRHSSGAT